MKNFCPRLGYAFPFVSLVTGMVMVAACSDDETTPGTPPAATTPAPTSSPPAATVTCSSAGVALCGGACVSTASDPKHCGGCDKACAATEACANGACVAQCTIDAKTYASGALNPGSSCEACTPATSATAWTKLADGTACNPGQVCKAGVCAPKCFIGGVVYDSGAVNPANDCEVCTPSTSTTAFTPRAVVPLLAGTDDIAAQGWTVQQQGPNTLTYGPDYVRLATTSPGQLLIVKANAVDPTKAWKLRVSLRVESANNHNQFDSAAAILGTYTSSFGFPVDRAQMVYLDPAAIGWADDSQSAALTVTDGAYHVYELAVDAAKVATFSVDGVQKLTRNDFVTNGTIAIGDQTNDPNVDGIMRIKSVERVCP